MNLEQIEQMPFSMAHDFTFGITVDKKTNKATIKHWSQNYDKNTGEYQMTCSELPDNVRTFSTVITNATDENGNYLGVPNLASLRKAMHNYFSAYIKGGKIVDITKTPEPVVVAEVKEVIAAVPDGRKKRNN